MIKFKPPRAFQESPPFIQRLSKTLYKALACLIWTPGKNQHLQYMFLLASNFQYILMLLWIQFTLFHSELKDSLALSIARICGFFLLKNIPESHSDYLLIFLYVYFATILSGMCFLCCQLVGKQAVSVKMKRAIFITSQFHLSAAFWTCSSILLYCIVGYAQENQILLFGKTSFGSPGLRAVHILLVVLNFFLAIIMSLFSYDPLKGSNVLSMTSPMFQILTFVFKGFVCLLLFWDNENKDLLNWILALGSVMITSSRHWNMMKIFPYYEFTPMNISLVMSTVSEVLSVSSLFTLGLREKISTTGGGESLILIQVLLVPLIVKLSKEAFERRMKRLVTTNKGELKSEEEVFNKIFALSYILKSADFSISVRDNSSLKELEQRGSWVYYSKLLGERGSDGEEVTLTSFNEVFSKYIYELLLTSIQKLQRNTNLKFFLANFILHKKMGFVKGLNYLQQVKEQCWYNSIKCWTLLDFYQEKSGDIFHGGLDMKVFIELADKSRALVEMIYANSKRYVEFWRLYTKTSLEVKRLVDRSEKIEEEDKRIRKFWADFDLKEKYLQKEFLMLYSIYLSLVRNATYSAIKLQRKMEAIFEINNPSVDMNATKNIDILNDRTLMSPENITMSISIAKDTFGKILQVSGSISETVGWTRRSILGKNFEAITPAFAKEEALKILKVDQENMLNKVISHYLILNKKGYLVPCNAYFCLHPNIKEGLRILAIFRATKEHNEFLVAEPCGVIKGFSAKIGATLNLSLAEKINIKNLCVDNKSPFDQEDLPVTGFFHFIPFRAVKGDKTREYYISVGHYHLNQNCYLINFLSGDFSSPTLSTFPSKEKDQVLPTLLHSCERTEENIIPPVGSARCLVLKTNFQNTMTEEAYRYDSYPEDPLSFRFNSEAAPIVTEENPSPRNKEDLMTNSKEAQSFLLQSPQNSNKLLQFEKAMYSVSKGRQIKILNYLFIAYIVKAVVLLIIFQGINSRTTETVTKNTEIATAALIRLMRLNNLHSQAACLVKIDDGVIFMNRYIAFGIPNLKYVCGSTMDRVSRDLLSANNRLRNLVEEIEERYSESLYKKIPVHISDDQGNTVENQTANSFDLTVQLAAVAQKISKTPLPKIKGNDANTYFLIKNILDDLLISSEMGLRVVTEDMNTKVSNFTKISEGFVTIIIISGACLFGYFMLVIFIIKRDREKILDIFQRLDGEMCKTHMQLVESFCFVMIQNDMDIQLFGGSLQKKRFFSFLDSLKQFDIRKRKLANEKGVHKALKKLTLATLASLFVIFLGFLVIVLLTHSQNQTITRKVNMLVTFNYHNYEHSLLKNVLPDYIAGAFNMTFRSRPFHEEWARTFKETSHMDQEFVQILDRETGFGEDEMLRKLITGNLCEASPAEIALFVGNPCDKVMNGLPKTGIKGIYDSSVYWMESLYANFEASNKTHNDSVKAMSYKEQIGLEFASFGYSKIAFEKISQRMESQLHKDVMRFNNRIKHTVVAFSLIYVLGVFVAWRWVERMLFKESIKWKGLFKMIPPAIVLSNKLMKFYLFQNKDSGTGYGYGPGYGPGY